MMYMYFTNPCARAECGTRFVFFERNLTGLKSEFFFYETGCHTKIKQHRLLCYLPMSRGKIVEFMTFLRLFALYGTPTASSYEPKHYTTCAFIENCSHGLWTNVCSW